MEEQLSRYSRQVLFQPIGSKGQQVLFEKKAAIVGMGALGTVVANHLVRAGVGKIKIIDRDFVEMSNLQRQLLYDESDATNHLPKVIAAKEKLNKINHEVIIEAVLTDVNPDNAEELLQDADVIVDGTDNFNIRYLINDVAVKHRIPWVYGGAVSSRGIFASIIPTETPCFRCLFPKVPSGRGETCDTVGVLSPMTDIIGSYEATEAIKLLIGAEPNPNLENIDIWHNSNMQMDVSDGRNQDCPTCVHEQYEFLEQTSPDQDSFVSMCGRNSVQINPRGNKQLDLQKLAKQFKEVGTVTETPFLVRFNPTEQQELTLVFFKDGRVLVQGTAEIAVAKQVYAKYTGN